MSTFGTEKSGAEFDPGQPGWAGKRNSDVRFGRIDADLGDVEEAAARARDYVFAQQHPEGYW